MSPVSLILEAALAANATASTIVNSDGGGGGGGGVGDAKKSGETETKNKRQIEQFLGSPGASFDASLGYDLEHGPQAYPSQLTHGIYNQQQRLPLYTRRPTGSSKSPVLPEDDVIEQERQLQSQQQVCSSHSIVCVVFSSLLSQTISCTFASDHSQLTFAIHSE